MVDNISNLNNPKIKYYKSLAQKKHRDLEGKFLIEGLRFIEEVVYDEKLLPRIEVLIYTNEFITNPRADKLIKHALANGIRVLSVDSKILKALSQTETPQGIVGVIRQDTIALSKFQLGEEPLIVVIDGIQDPGNLGTIIRTAHAAGATGVLITKGTVDLYNQKVLRSTMGSIFKVQIINGLEPDEIISLLKDKKINVMVADIGENSQIYYNCNWRQPIAFVVGSEANGPREVFLQQAKERINIPMPGGAESLNVAIATGIILFEALRQREL